MDIVKRAKAAGVTVEEFRTLLELLDCRVMSKGETPAEAAENVTGGNPKLDKALVNAYNGN